MKLLSLLKLLVQKLCLSQNAVNYLCGNEALPQPLTAEEEADYFAQMTQGSELARDKLVEHNLRLVVFLAKKFEIRLFFLWRYDIIIEEIHVFLEDPLCVTV